MLKLQSSFFIFKKITAKVLNVDCFFTRLKSIPFFKFTSLNTTSAAT